MNYKEAKAKKVELYAELDATSLALTGFPRGKWGLTPDDVKRSPEFIAAKAAYDRAFARARAFNGFFNKTFKAEYNAERRANRPAPLQAPLPKS